jgi:hypothetical protein
VLIAASFWLGSSCGGGSRGQDSGREDPELQRRVEELMPRIAELARLPVRRVPAVRRASPETLEAYLLERLEAEYPGDTLENLQLAYRAFGLIPDTVEVRELLIDLLLEQAVGYYDPVRDIFYVRDEAPEAMLDIVLVHELVHALQDQEADLDSLAHSVSGNDARAAIQAAMEGHATAVMMAFQFAKVTGSTLSADQLPELGPEMADALADPSAFPRLAQAPAIVREPLLFAYLGGARYVQRLWRSIPEKPAPFGEWLPESTEQLIHTERILEQRDSPTLLGLSEPGNGWRLKYTSDLGELETRIYFQEHLGDREIAAGAAAGWDGDVYALLSKGDDLALVWYTVWDSETDAEQFAAAYREAFAARFGDGGAGDRLLSSDREARLDRITLSGVPIVRVIETRPGVTLERPPEVRIVTTSQ